MRRRINYHGWGERYSDVDYLLYKICFHGAPTLSKVKPASLICFRNSQSAQLKTLWEANKEVIESILPCKFVELRSCSNGVNVLFYQPRFLEVVLRRKDTKAYLEGLGYGQYETVDQALALLKQAYAVTCPNEIGIFLGYPLSDVKDFACKSREESIGVGYWRVYSNLKKAKKLFNLYDSKRLSIMDALETGKSPYELLLAM